MYSTRGRPRTVTDEQVRKILEWHRTKLSLTQFAASIQLSKRTVEYVIRIQGRYKQPSPEMLEHYRERSRRRRERLSRDGWL